MKHRVRTAGLAIWHSDDTLFERYTEIQSWGAYFRQSDRSVRTYVIPKIKTTFVK